MDMNMKALFERQAELDKHINDKHQLKQGEDRVAKKVLSFMTEVSELVNELPEVFKFWSKKKNDYVKALEEYVDTIHFVLSIGNDIGYDSFDELEMNEYLVSTQLEQDYSLVNHFIEINFIAAGLIESDIYYEQLLFEVLNLGDKLGFTWGEIEQAYYSKNDKNHKRQESGVY